MEATTDAATPLNLAQHTYFNLNGEANGTVLDHYLQLNSCALLPRKTPTLWLPYITYACRAFIMTDNDGETERPLQRTCGGCLSCMAQCTAHM